MADVVDVATRSRMMSGIRSRNTRPELIIRQGLHRRGLRYRLHVKKLPGCPDIVFGHRRAVVFVHGCFWHGHDCPLFKWPRSREEFWLAKIEGNKDRDTRAIEALITEGWRVAVVWECAIKGRGSNVDDVLDRLVAWLNTEKPRIEVRG